MVKIIGQLINPMWAFTYTVHCLFFSLFLMGPCNKNSNKEKSPLKSETRMSFDKKKSLASHFPDFGPNPNFRSDQNPNPCAFYFKNIKK